MTAKKASNERAHEASRLHDLAFVEGKCTTPEAVTVWLEAHERVLEALDPLQSALLTALARLWVMAAREFLAEQ